MKNELLNTAASEGGAALSLDVKLGDFLIFSFEPRVNVLVQDDPEHNQRILDLLQEALDYLQPWAVKRFDTFKYKDYAPDLEDRCYADLCISQLPAGSLIEFGETLVEILQPAKVTISRFVDTDDCTEQENQAKANRNDLEKLKLGLGTRFYFRGYYGLLRHDVEVLANMEDLFCYREKRVMPNLNSFIRLEDEYFQLDEFHQLTDIPTHVTRTYSMEPR